MTELDAFDFIVRGLYLIGLVFIGWFVFALKSILVPIKTFHDVSASLYKPERIKNLVEARVADEQGKLLKENKELKEELLKLTKQRIQSTENWQTAVERLVAFMEKQNAKSSELRGGLLAYVGYSAAFLSKQQVRAIVDSVPDNESKKILVEFVTQLEKSGVLRDYNPLIDLQKPDVLDKSK